MKTNKYKYQETAAKEVLEMALSQRYIAAVLAAAPGSGKSTIAIHALNEFFKRYPDQKAVILTHNQTLLQDQMLDNFDQPNVPVNFTYGGFGEDVQVQVGIPASRHNITEFDLLIIDEAHQYYLESMYEEIVAKHDPEYEILLTGTPSYFVRYNKAVGSRNLGRFGIYFIAASDLKDIFSSVDIDVAVTSMSNVVSRYNAAAHQAKTFKSDLTKIMVATKTIKEANELKYYLISLGRKVSLSTSQNDTKNTEISKYRNGETDTLIVVNRGILGFSDNNTTALIDLKPTSNLDSRYQLFARILRRHPQNIRKTYISTVSKENFNKEVKTLNNMVLLMDRENFINHTGR